jgi:hypothetical protein
MPTEPDYLSPYIDAAHEVGARFEALLWKNPAAQQARFDALIDMTSPTGRTVADLGCGLADLHTRMTDRNAGHTRYIGVEAVGPLAGAAKDRLSKFGSRRAEIVEADFAADESLFDRLVTTERSDLVIFSGSLNTFPLASALPILDRAWTAVARRRGAMLAFNFLSDRCEPGRRAEATAPAHRFDTLAVLDWAMQRTPIVSFRQDYLLGHDATVVMQAASG